MSLMMIGALDILRRERDDAAEQIRTLRSRIRDLEAAIGVLEGQPAQSKEGRGAPGDFKLNVLQRLQELGTTGATPKELADAFVQAGRVTSDASVSSTLSRLKGESKVTNRSGRWFAANASPDSRAQLDHPSWDELDDMPF